jgi:hypothetical protein
MLSRIENVYLNILRVTVLAAAGLLLAAAVAAGAAALLSASRTFASDTEAESSGLAEFIAERRLALAAESRAPAAPSRQSSDPVALSPAIDEAAASFARYLGRQNRNAITRRGLIEILNERWLDTPPEHVGAYARSLRSLARDLDASTGRPLSREHFLELIAWHHGRMLAESASGDLDRNAAVVAAWQWAGWALQAFLLFVVVAFYFLLVRVERHLRLVRIQSVDGPDAASEAPAGEAP